MTRSNNKPTFGRWLSEYKGENPIIRDLRDDFNSDIQTSEFTLRNYRRAEAVRNRLKIMGACDGAMDALEEAPEEYGTPLKEYCEWTD